MGLTFNMAGGPPLPLLTSPGAAGDLRAGTQLIDNNGDVLTGTLPEVEQATPTISVSDGGLITASANQAGGIVTAGSKSATDQLATQAAKTVTPGTAQQVAVPAGVYTTGAVTVQGDINLKPENIAEGVSIFGVQGAFAGGGGTVTAMISSSYKWEWNGVLNGELIAGGWSSGGDLVDANSIIIVNPRAFNSVLTTVEITGGATQLSDALSNYNNQWVAFFVSGNCTITFS